MVSWGFGRIRVGLRGSPSEHPKHSCCKESWYRQCFQTAAYTQRNLASVISRFGCLILANTNHLLSCCLGSHWQTISSMVFRAWGTSVGCAAAAASAAQKI